MYVSARALRIITVGLGVAGGVSTASAHEYPIGVPQTKAGMVISAVYLQPIKMEPAGIMRPAAKSDVHLEADIHAAKNNPNGFAEDDWIPYLRVKYKVTKSGDSHVLEGMFMPMVANDGPHYGDNAKLMGPGKYTLTLTISPPGRDFGRHVDKETGVGPWFKPFSVSFNFIYAGVGKKGAY